MRPLSRKWKLGLSLVGVSGLLLYMEVISYIINTRHWTLFEPQALNSQQEDSLRVLLVADPQIIGENDELPFLGLFTRWDADRYLQRNFMLAKHYTQPHVVAFLGDLFDEGSKAVDQEYRRYIRRFNDIFQIPRKQDPSPIDYVFLPGDNDVGGEGAEPVNPVKVKWFNQTFGDFRKELWVERAGLRAQFIKMNLILPEEYQNPTKGREHLKEGVQPDFRILMSHTSLLQFRTNSVNIVLAEIRPQIVFSAHSHHSSYLKLDNQLDKITHDFLMAHKHPSKQWHLKGVPYFSQPEIPGDEEIDAESLNLQVSSSITLDLDKESSVVHEISVPTCSYRMGVPHSGYGAFHLYKNGTMKYTVLWLPSRFNQLYYYLFIYFLMKFSAISWCLWKITTYLYHKSSSHFSLGKSGFKFSHHKV